ncbi:MAG: hypothetical protein Kow0074_16730 [Candidatus Zixiibacteriota bacterium]
MPNTPFLPTHDLRPGDLKAVDGVKPRGLIVSDTGSGCEIAVFDASAKPNRQTIREIWSKRWGKRPISLLVVALCGDRCSVCGHTSDGNTDPPVFHELSVRNVERICETALSLATGEEVHQFLRDQLPEAGCPTALLWEWSRPHSLMQSSEMLRLSAVFNWTQLTCIPSYPQ